MADVGHLEAGGDFADTDMMAYLPQRFPPKYTPLFAKQFLICVTRRLKTLCVSASGGHKKANGVIKLRRRLQVIDFNELRQVLGL